MKKLLVSLTAALSILLVSCSGGADNAREACKAAEKGDVAHAIEYADKAYKDFDRLNTDALCRLAASYAVITLNTGDQQMADRFQQCYKASLNTNPQEAEKIYAELDPQMADGLAIISGLLEGRDNFSTVGTDNQQPDPQRDSAEAEEAEIANEGLALD